MSEQLAMDFAHASPPAPAEPRKPTLAERFEAWRIANPDVVALVVELAREAKASGLERYSTKSIFERIRWHYRIERRDVDFKINNSFAAPLSRWVQANYEDLDGFFETRGG